MFCVIQQVQRRKPDLHGAYREIEVSPLKWSVGGVERVPVWKWRYGGGRFERPHREAYKITLHQSYREGGKVRKRQYSVCTVGWYDLAEYSLFDCAGGCIEAAAQALGVSEDDLYTIIERKLEPLQKCIRDDFSRSEEEQARAKHERTLKEHREACSRFCKRYDVDEDEYCRCYDVFGTLRNKEYLEQIKSRYHAQHSYERAYQEQSYRFTDESGSYSVSVPSNHTDDERDILKQFYRVLSKKFHPDMNPDKDTTREMQVLNKLKEEWRI